MSLLLFLLNISSYTFCRDKGLVSYIGPWILSEDIDRSKEEQIVIRGSQLKSHK